MAIEIIRPADRQAWLDARSKDVTASICSALFGLNPWVSPYRLWAIKSGRVEESQEVTDAMQRGLDFEEVVVKRLRRERPNWQIDYRADNTYFRDPSIRLGATPDTFATRDDVFGQGTVQLKTKSWHSFRESWHDPETGEVTVPLDVAVQTIVEAHLTGSVWAAVAVLVVDPYDFHVIDVPVHEKLIRRIRNLVTDFWTMVESGKEPEPDWLRDGAAVAEVYRDSMPDRKDLTASSELDHAAARFVDAREAHTLSGKAIDDLRPRILHALGAAECGFTTNWNITARTSVRNGPDGRPVKSRALRITPKENPDARF